MLITFSVKNYRSIREEQILSLVKDNGEEHQDSNTFSPLAPGTTPLLRSTAIYGANAAGKSNVVRAIMDMEYIVITSASASQEGDELSLTPFLFDDYSADRPTEFEMIFVSEGIKYQFGFSATKKHIVEEWLIAYPKERPQRWYSRVFNEKSKKDEYKFSGLLSGKKALWSSATRSNALFLSTAVQLNSEQLKPVFNWFKVKLRPAHYGGWGPGFSATQCEEPLEKEKILKLVNAADFDIEDVKVSKEEFDPESLQDDLPEHVKKAIIREMKDKQILDIKTIHKTPSGKPILLSFEEESDGTQKFFSFAGPWIDSLDQGYILVIDELHDDLHPRLVEYLVSLFHSSKTNPNNAQLIFTTHETTILNQDIFRRDQIWFCEKDSEQSTSLYPLSDFSPRKDRENIMQGYLSGRYGALPTISPLKMDAM